jgi:hypothetical protein
MKNHTYIVRVWLEPNPGGSSIWRASVLDSSSQERWYFSSADRLAEFLYEANDSKINENLETRTLH